MHPSGRSSILPEILTALPRFHQPAKGNTSRSFLQDVYFDPSPLQSFAFFLLFTQHLLSLPPCVASHALIFIQTSRFICLITSLKQHHSSCPYTDLLQRASSPWFSRGSLPEHKFTVSSLHFGELHPGGLHVLRSASNSFGASQKTKIVLLLCFVSSSH